MTTEAIQIFNITSDKAGRPRVIEAGPYSPIALRVDHAATNAQVRLALETFATFFRKL